MTAGAARLALNPTRPRSHGTKKYDQTTHLELLILVAGFMRASAKASRRQPEAVRPGAFRWRAKGVSSLGGYPQPAWPPSAPGRLAIWDGGHRLPEDIFGRAAGAAWLRMSPTPEKGSTRAGDNLKAKNGESALLPSQGSAIKTLTESAWTVAFGWILANLLTPDA